MPYVNVRITRKDTTPEQKAAVIKGVTDVLVQVLKKNPASTVVVIDEVETENWGIGGLPAEEFHRRQKATAS